MCEERGLGTGALTRVHSGTLSYILWSRFHRLWPLVHMQGMFSNPRWLTHERISDVSQSWRCLDFGTLFLWKETFPCFGESLTTVIIWSHLHSTGTNKVSLYKALWWGHQLRDTAYPCFFSVLCSPQEGAKEYAMLHNPRSKCSGRRRRRHPVVSASCSNASASAMAETKEGDSDRDTGNDWASSSSGKQKMPSS